ncbi:hypothetical protein HPB47_023358 [Ixodes persulcatus]|uniref:Uncharacterized protein n=1 Tax=Ixodes persulcatus TaxID=34615 RepID=A0AC60Q766_IXOPE|nr:hypothetical protein HPB47_023358 [Ixodes persulcatus]
MKYNEVPSELEFAPLTYMAGYLAFVCEQKVACWNAPRGCGFIGPVACLLDHYKECDFGVMPCCLCHSAVLQSNISEHFKNGCSIPQAPRDPTDNPATQVLKDVNRTCLEMKKVMGKISDDLMSLQTSLNQCSEGVRVEGRALEVGSGHGLFAADLELKLNSMERIM